MSKIRDRSAAGPAARGKSQTVPRAALFSQLFVPKSPEITDIHAISGLGLRERSGRSRRGLLGAALLVAWLACLAAAGPAAAEGKLGGHFGIVVPIVTEVDGETITVSDDFVIGFPMGITVRKNDRIAFDLELVPVIQDSPQEVSLTVHPGVLFSLPRSFTVGVRMAFDIDGDAWGFTPLVARGFPLKNRSATYFIELDFPIRRLRSDDTSVAFAFHTGIGF